VGTFRYKKIEDHSCVIPVGRMTRKIWVAVGNVLSQKVEEKWKKKKLSGTLTSPRFDVEEL
jgi:hypothetical protein